MISRRGRRKTTKGTTTLAAIQPSPAIPVVVISGGHQPASEVQAHARLAAASRNGRHVVATGSGHWINFDQPEIIVDAVRTLVAMVASSTRLERPVPRSSL